MEQESKKREGKEVELPSSNPPILCANNCGFFRSSATSNLCSKCHGEAFLSESKASVDTVTAPATAEADDGVEAVELLGKKPVNRCGFCNKRVGLMGFKCRCGNVFCSLHLYSEKHNCVFDFKGAGQDAIAKANPVVKADKVDKTWAPADEQIQLSEEKRQCGPLVQDFKNRNQMRQKKEADGFIRR